MRNPVTRLVLAYVAVLFVLTYALNAVVWAQGGLSNPRMFQILVGLQMLLPAVVAVAFRVFRREGFKGSGLGLGKKRYFLVAFGLMIAYLGVSYGLSALTPWLTFDPQMGKFQAMLDAIQAQTGQTPPFDLRSFAALMAVQVVLLGALLGMPAYWGEEYGWRGYLLPKLLETGMDKGRAIVLHGVIWGLWHAPIIAMGHNYPGYPLAGIALMTVFCIGMGAIYAWLFYASGSIWVPAFAHGVLNQGAPYAAMWVASSHVLLAAPVGLVALGVLAIMVGLLAWRGAFQVVGRPLA